VKGEYTLIGENVKGPAQFPPGETPLTTTHTQMLSV
jgi:hypothetical protein